MLCAIDNDVITEPLPKVEQVVLLTPDEAGRASTILDIHPNRESPNGIQFEDPKWRNHLGLLKPLGLNFLVSSVKYHLSTIMTIFMHQFEDSCHNNMH